MMLETRLILAQLAKKYIPKYHVNYRFYVINDRYDDQYNFILESKREGEEVVISQMIYEMPERNQLKLDRILDELKTRTHLYPYKLHFTNDTLENYHNTYVDTETRHGHGSIIDHGHPHPDH